MKPLPPAAITASLTREGDPPLASTRSRTRRSCSSVSFRWSLKTRDSSSSPAMSGAVLSWARACSSIECASARYLFSCVSMSSAMQGASPAGRPGKPSRAVALAHLREHPRDVDQRTEVAELLRIHDRPDRLDPAVGDLQRGHAPEAPLGIPVGGARLAVHLEALEPQVERPELLHEAGEHLAHPVAPVDRPRRGRRLAAPLPVEDHLRREHLHQTFRVAVLRRLEEALSQLLAPLARGLEARLAVLQPAPGADGQLARVVLAPADHLGDLAVAVAEHLAQQE